LSTQIKALELELDGLLGGDTPKPQRKCKVCGEVGHRSDSCPSRPEQKEGGA
jgi:Zinc knuckle